MSSHAGVRRRFLFLLPLLSALSPVYSQFPAQKGLLDALRRGGCVIVMRHASSPNAPPGDAQANADNVQRERQLDEVGRTSARAMGDALRRLRIPIGQVLSSPTYRALETVRLAQLGQARIYSQLGDGGQSMRADPTGKRASWLRAKVAETPPVGTNTMIVTHFPNIDEAFKTDAARLADGEALVFRPDGHGRIALIGRVKIEHWPILDSGR